MSSKSFPHRFVAIEGNIGAGKTTLSKLLAKDFNCRLILEQFTDNPFLPSFYENPERHAFPVELFFMAERHKQLQEQLSQPGLFQKNTIADYFFIKTLLFARNNLNTEEFQLFQRLYSILNASFPKPDLLIYLHRPIPQLLKNITKRGRAFESEITSDYLKKIQTAYFEYFNTQPTIPILLIHLGGKDFSENLTNYNLIANMIMEDYEIGLHNTHL